MISSILVGIWATLNGIVSCEALTWFVRGCPLITGTITGILMGDWRSGAIIGATINLLYMGQITVGGVASYDKCYAGVISTAVTIAANQSADIGITIAVALGTLGLAATSIYKTVCIAFVHMADRYVEEGKTDRIWIYNWLLPQCVSLLLYGIPAFIAVQFGAPLLESILNTIPAFVTTALSTVGKVLPALGIAMMLKTVFNPKFAPFAIFGYLAVAYLGMDMIAVALLGGACAVLYITMGFSKLTEGEE